jgi:CDP-paratose synthetase
MKLLNVLSTSENHQTVGLSRTRGRTSLSGEVSYDVITLSDAVREFPRYHFDMVVHMACCYGRNGEPLSELIRANIMSGLEIIESDLISQDGTFLNMETALFPQVSHYAMSKKFFSGIAKAADLPVKFVNARTDLIYGGDEKSERLFSHVLETLIGNNQPLKLSGGKQSRYFIHTEDVISGLVSALNFAESNSGDFTDFDICPDHPLELKTFIEQVVSSLEGYMGPSSTNLQFGALKYREGEFQGDRLDNHTLKSFGWKSEFSDALGIDKAVTDYLRRHSMLYPY